MLFAKETHGKQVLIHGPRVPHQSLHHQELPHNVLNTKITESMSWKNPSSRSKCSAPSRPQKHMPSWTRWNRLSPHTPPIRTTHSKPFETIFRLHCNKHSYNKIPNIQQKWMKSNSSCCAKTRENIQTMSLMRTLDETNTKINSFRNAFRFRECCIPFCAISQSVILMTTSEILFCLCQIHFRSSDIQ